MKVTGLGFKKTGRRKRKKNEKLLGRGSPWRRRGEEDDEVGSRREGIGGAGAGEEEGKRTKRRIRRGG